MKDHRHEFGLLYLKMYGKKKPGHWIKEALFPTNHWLKPNTALLALWQRFRVFCWKGN